MPSMAKKVSARATVEAENAGLPNSVTSSAGCVMRRSSSTNRASTASPPRIDPSTCGLVHCKVSPPLMIP